MGMETTMHLHRKEQVRVEPYVREGSIWIDIDELDEEGWKIGSMTIFFRNETDMIDFAKKVAEAVGLHVVSKGDAEFLAEYKADSSTAGSNVGKPAAAYPFPSDAVNPPPVGS